MIQKNLFIGVIFIILTAIITSIGSITNKEIMLRNLDFHLFLVFSTFFGFIFSVIIYFFTKAMKGNFAIAYTINSFNILIPIILSIIFFKEHFNFKKAFVIALSIIFIILFI